MIRHEIRSNTGACTCIPAPVLSQSTVYNFLQNVDKKLQILPYIYVSLGVGKAEEINHQSFDVYPGSKWTLWTGAELKDNSSTQNSLSKETEFWLQASSSVFRGEPDKKA